MARQISKKLASDSDAPKAAARRSTTKNPRPTILPSEDQIRQRAYEVFLARNGNPGPGDAHSDWTLAERQLQEELNK